MSPNRDCAILAGGTSCNQCTVNRKSILNWGKKAVRWSRTFRSTSSLNDCTFKILLYGFDQWIFVSPLKHWRPFHGVPGSLLDRLQPPATVNWIKERTWMDMGDAFNSTQSVLWELHQLGINMSMSDLCAKHRILVLCNIFLFLLLHYICDASKRDT